VYRAVAGAFFYLNLVASLAPVDCKRVGPLRIGKLRTRHVVLETLALLVPHAKVTAASKMHIKVMAYASSHMAPRIALECNSASSHTRRQLSLHLNQHYCS
jgi:hypothetical protein